ncbi:Spore maturation protein A [Eubacterium plexicaudatum ASF492]|uniref:Nucleoside transporter/FeoB GTPase Gate domain-containing protein n=1 Tax=Eubacterium plexicaudatum ASF492 TaxID=1235802 RepID=N2B3S9_9FIRM|nr:Spore maturation protein A [Eubacterium plexicaudatum ASF492]
MNYLWGFMIVSGIIYAAFTGSLPEVTQAAIDSSKEAVTLCITMTGVMSLWMGLMRIAEKAGIIAGAVKGMKPLLRFLFPTIQKNHLANQYIAENFIANVFGLGWAATPAGIRAVEELEKLEEKRREGNFENILDEKYGRKRKKGKLRVVPKGTASNEMCTFLILNISSLQLIPVNMIAYRSQYGSVNPASIVGPAIVATLVSTIVAIIFCKIMDRKR